MFKKLVSNLPFNPSLFSHLRDYDLKLKKQLKLRFVSMIIMLLIIIVQLVVIFWQPNLSTYSPNNLLNNSNGSLSQLLSDCNNNQGDYKIILNFYNLNCSDLYSAKTINLNLNSKSKLLYSLNRLSYDSSIETSVIIDKQKFYIRLLTHPNNQTSIKVKVIYLTSGPLYIALQSGTLISNEETLINNFVQPKCTPIQPTSCFTYSLSVSTVNSNINDANNTTEPSGSTLIYTLSAFNKSNYKISGFGTEINFQNALAYSNIVNTYGGINKNGIVSYRLNPTLPLQTQTEVITVRIKSSIPNHAVSSTDSNYFAQKMIVSFGNTTTIYLPKSFNKFYEMNINNYLPSISSGLSLVIVLIILVILVYLLVRTIVIRDEIKVLRHSHSNHKEIKK